MNWLVQRRLENLERRFLETDDTALLDRLCRATQGDMEARADLERRCATGKGHSGLRDLALGFLSAPAEPVGLEATEEEMKEMEVVSL